MAWQLIYTSAPRSLEAGRSGFGTVARHRELSPLLASAIERVSQFSRLPGVDTDRVIFSYRIVAVAGGRFLVLSSIRDAGADYTGRTNHIAHHVIVDPREVAQLGPNGPSPADVLLGMKWATAWNEPPRYFEAADEVRLSRLCPQANGSTWARITGNPNQAWLLASGDASRGAYVIQPDGADLREVFAESLRLMPERRWQISFTTSLQPSDEPADFRWIGIEERSPLRAQTETSGRPVLNLASPRTLPLVEVAEPVATVPSRQAVARTFPSGSTEDSGNPAEPLPAVPPAARPSLTPGSRTAEPPRSMPQRRRSYANWILPGVAAIFVSVALLGLLVGWPLYQDYQHKKMVRAEIENTLGKSGFFPDRTFVQLRSARAVDAAKDLAVAADRSWEIAKNADFAAMLTLPDEAVRKRARAAGLNTPADINELDDRLAKIGAIYQWLRDLHAEPEHYEALNEIEKRRTEADELASPMPRTSTFDKVKTEIASAADRQRANVFRALLTGNGGRIRPSQDLAWFTGRLAERKVSLPDGETKMVFNAVQEVMGSWRLVDTYDLQKGTEELEKRLKAQSVWPAWLQTLAHEKIDSVRPKMAPLIGNSKELPTTSSVNGKFEEKPAALSRTPLYFVNGKDTLSNFRIEELSPGLKYFLKVGGEPTSAELYDPTNTGNLRRSMGDANASFSVDKDQKVFRVSTGGTSILPPFQLSAKNNGTEVFQVWVGAGADKPLFPHRSAGVRRNGNLVYFDPSVLGVTGTPKNVLSVGLPDSCFAGNARSVPLVLEEWTVDLTLERTKIEATYVAWRHEIGELQKKLNEPTKDNVAEFDQQVKALETGKSFAEDEKKHLAAPGASLRERCGGYIKAISQNPKISGFDKLFTVGGKLKDLDRKADAAAELAAIRAVNDALQTAHGNLRTKEEKEKYAGSLEILKKMLALIQPESPDAKANREKQRAGWERQIAGLTSSLAITHPLTIETQPPPGVYRLYAKDAGVNMLLVEIEVGQKP